MSKYQNTQYNHFKAVKSLLKDTYRMAHIYNPNQSDFNELREHRVYSTNHYKRLNGYYRATIRGIDSQLFDNLFIYHLTYCYKVDDKVYIDYRDNFTPSELTELVQSGKAEGNYYWIKSLKSNPKSF